MVSSGANAARSRAHMQATMQNSIAVALPASWMAIAFLMLLPTLSSSHPARHNVCLQQ